MTMSELPPDWVEEILCLVPATNLKRLRATCKGWNRLIKDDRRFQKKHFEKAAKQYRPLLLRNDLRVCSLSVNLPSEDVKIEKLRLVDPRSMNEFDIHSVFHCDGLLVCTSEDRSTVVVWNPCTGETKWIRPGNLFGTYREVYIGYYIDNNSGNKSYKLWSKDDFGKGKQPSLIYDFDSDSWRIIDDDVSPGCSVPYNEWAISLQGDIYWIGSRETDNGLYLLTFDFSTEKSQHLPLPYQRSWYANLCLSVVRDEKLCVLASLENTSKTEIWVTNKINDTTKPVSWSKLLSLDLSPELQLSCEGSFFLDEEKKIVIFIDRWMDIIDDITTTDMVYIVGEDNKVISVKFGVDPHSGCWPAILNYVPSLVQIKPPAPGKRKRAD